MFNYQLGLVYKPTRNGSVYVSYATASTPPSVSGGDQEGLSVGMSDLKPEKSATLELGTKWKELDERLSLTAEIVQKDRRDAQTEVDRGRVEQVGQTWEEGRAG